MTVGASSRLCIICTPASSREKITEEERAIKELDAIKILNLNRLGEEQRIRLIECSIRLDCRVSNAILLASQQNYDLHQSAKHTPLSLCVKYDRFTFFKELIKKQKATINFVYNNGENVAYAIICCTNPFFRNYIIERANLSQVKDNGWTLIGVLEGTRPFHIKSLRTKITQYTPPKHVEYSNTMLHVKHLAHVFKMGGMYVCRTKTQETFDQFSLEGHFYRYMQKKIARSLRDFAEIYYPDKKQDINLFVEALKKTNSSRYCPSDIATFYSVNNFAVIPTGFVEHYVSVMLFDRYFILINRGKHSRKSVEVFSFDPTSLHPDFFSDLNDLREHASEEYIQHMFTDLESLLNLQKGEFEEFLESLLNLANQLVGNCTWDNSEGLVFVFMALISLFKAGLLASKDRNKCEQLVCIQESIFKNWLIFHQIKAIQENITFLSRFEYPFATDNFFLNQVLNKVKMLSSWLLHDSIYRCKKGLKCFLNPPPLLLIKRTISASPQRGKRHRTR